MENGEDDNVDTIKILVATDNHLGYGEKYTERQLDSFVTFNEILKIGKEKEVDFVLLGGDLFHENKPTRFAEHQCMKVLKKHVFGDRPVEIEVISDPEINFSHCDPNHRVVNYMDPNLNIGLPIFSIHGNHDDPCGLGGFCSLDNLHTAGLLNFFGKTDNLQHVEVSPLLFVKGENRVALYGLSNIKDERLHRLFRENAVKMDIPEENQDDWFNLFVLHQNRAKHTNTNYIPENFIPEIFDLVIWGHEHECRLNPEYREFSDDHRFFISQPGSSVATSLCEAEAGEKSVGLLQVRGKDFKMDSIPLETVRPMIFKNVSLNEASPDFTPPDVSKCKTDKEVQAKVEESLKKYVEKLLQTELPKKLTGNLDQPTKPLVRVRVEYTREDMVLSIGRFGNHFLQTIANPNDILLFKKLVYVKSQKDESGLTAQDLEELVPENMAALKIEDYIDEFLDSGNIGLELLGTKGLASAVDSFVNKGHKGAVKGLVNKQMNKIVEKMNELEVDDQALFKTTLEDLKRQTGTGVIKEEVIEDEDVENNQESEDEFFEQSGQPSASVQRSYPSTSRKRKEVSSDSDIEIPPTESPKRGRGRGRGRARGRGTTSPKPKRGRGGGRGRAKNTQVLESDEEMENLEPPRAARGRGARGRASASKKAATPARGAGNIQSAFFRQSQMSNKSQRSNVMYESDDSD